MKRSLKEINGIVTFDVAIAQADVYRKMHLDGMAELWEYLAVMTMQLNTAQRKIDLLERNSRGI